MDGERFDALSRAIGSQRPRRGLLKGVLGGSVGGALAMMGLSRSSAAQPAMVGVCHFTGSSRQPYLYIKVPEQFVSIYEARGDLVSCPGEGVLNTSTCECDCSLTDVDCNGSVSDSCTCIEDTCSVVNDTCGPEHLDCSCANDIETDELLCVDHSARGGSENRCDDHSECPEGMYCAVEDSCYGGYCYPLCGEVEEHMHHFGPYSVA